MSLRNIIIIIILSKMSKLLISWTLFLRLHIFTWVNFNPLLGHLSKRELIMIIGCFSKKCISANNKERNHVFILADYVQQMPCLVYLRCSRVLYSPFHFCIVVLLDCCRGSLSCRHGRQWRFVVVFLVSMQCSEWELLAWWAVPRDKIKQWNLI